MMADRDGVSAGRIPFLPGDRGAAPAGVNDYLHASVEASAAETPSRLDLTRDVAALIALRPDERGCFRVVHCEHGEAWL